MSAVLDATDDRLLWSGVWSLERGDGWLAPWRIPYPETDLYFPTGGYGVASMPSGVRISLRTDARRMVCRYGTTPPLSETDPPELPRLDVVVDGVLHRTVMLERSAEGAEFTIDDLPGGPRLVEIWLPLYYQFRLYQIRLDEGTAVQPDDRRRPVWVHYGCSISQGRGAASPSRTFLAQTASVRNLDLRSLSVAGSCLLQPRFARLIRDTPAQLITVHTGTNIYYYGSLNRETLQGAVFGLVRTIRDRQSTTPIVLISPTFGPRYETQPGPSKLTHRLVRRELAAAVERLRARRRAPALRQRAGVVRQSGRRPVAGEAGRTADPLFRSGTRPGGPAPDVATRAVRLAGSRDPTLVPHRARAGAVSHPQGRQHLATFGTDLLASDSALDFLDQIAETPAEHRSDGVRRVLAPAADDGIGPGQPLRPSSNSIRR